MGGLPRTGRVSEGGSRSGGKSGGGEGSKGTRSAGRKAGRRASGGAGKTAAVAATRPRRRPAGKVAAIAAARRVRSGDSGKPDMGRFLPAAGTGSDHADHSVVASVLTAARLIARATALAEAEERHTVAAARAAGGTQLPPSPDEGPLELLERSHRRLDERLAELQQAVSAVVRQRGGPADLAIIESVTEFLERAVLRHEEDEEVSLFPRLRGIASLSALLDDLATEHMLHRHLVKQLRSMVVGWPPTGPDAADGASLVVLVNELARAYRGHMEREERELLPVAREQLSRTDRDEIRAEMIQRRTTSDYDSRRNRGGGARRRYPAGSTGPRIRNI